MSTVPSNRRGRPSRADYDAPTQLELKTLVVRMDPALHHKFHLHAVSSGSNMATLVRQFIEQTVKP